MEPYEIWAWEPSLSPHKLPYYQALVASGRVAKVTYVAREDLAPERRALGWQIDSTSGIDVVLSPSPHEARRLVEQSSPSSIHVFAGMRGALIAEGLSAAVACKRRFGLLSEPRASEGVRGLLRHGHSLVTEGALRRHCDFVLAIGKNGPPWFLRTGYRPDRVFPFAYFVMTPPDAGKPSPNALPTVAYLGRLTEAKGVPIVLKAREQLNGAFNFIIAGMGEMEQEVRDAASRPGLTYVGPLKMPETPAFLSQADVVCAPSTTTEDGWCAVVGEALFSGTPVVTTPKVGAAICIEQDPILGRVVPPDADAVAGAITELLAPEYGTQDARAWRRAWATRHVSAEAGARTFLQILDYIYQGGAHPQPFYN